MDESKVIQCETHYLDLIVPSLKYKHTICYYLWRKNNVVLQQQPTRYIYCFHRLAGNGKEFDYLARQLLERINNDDDDDQPIVVVCADVCGRGQSQYLEDPQDYEYKTYIADAMALINHVSPNQPIDLIGTSMGGLIGISLLVTSFYNKLKQETADDQQQPKDHFVVLNRNDNININQQPTALLPYIEINRLILNDVGAFVTLESLSSIASYVGCMPTFSSRQEATQFFQKVYNGFGNLTDDQWSYFVDRCIIPENENKLKFHFDPSISINLKKVESDVDMWSFWNNIIVKSTKQILILRGKLSKILTNETFNRMVNGNDNVQGIEFENVGHAPSLLVEDQIQPIIKFLS
ncbi:hypothetical protein DFA_02519 [Cavenderia fasciculata]|uniref:AB hydrolase-1 domain-containing protein n=1 Tax=Cavenderia fasciculata TaxID=261658 RepID=F4PZL6_CACFS|nr:uncharacterized protein DFA_02519 [Cavenderia fasciculata]EGG18780.1 hypothetical protein DFA_02519 [Cavenderia fasciculata]|eukprot:XP_004357242.1 hypothetical protein DFA_02519 [Cavenderia fasciculata]